ncbi:putative reverse transcriptase domain-containing protein [Tanacetum coccineum]
MHRCSYKTFMNGKPHSLKGTEGVVGLKLWFEKIEKVFEICKCAEDYKVKFAMCTFEGRALTCNESNDGKELWTLTLKEMISKLIPGRAARIGKSNKRKWEDNQRNNNNNRNRNNNHHQQQNRRPETVKAYAAAPAGGKNLCNDFLQNVTCFGCGEKGHFKDKCPKAGNQQNDGARRRAYVVIENPQQNPNVVTDDLLVYLMSESRVSIDLIPAHRQLLDLPYRCVLFSSRAGSGYSSVESREEDMPKTAFRTRYGTLCSLVKPFGANERTEIFMDYEPQESMKSTWKTILDYSEEKLYAKFSKCNIWLQEVQF